MRRKGQHAVWRLCVGVSTWTELVPVAADRAVVLVLCLLLRILCAWVKLVSFRSSPRSFNNSINLIAVAGTTKSSSCGWGDKDYQNKIHIGLPDTRRFNSVPRVHLLVFHKLKCHLWISGLWLRVCSYIVGIGVTAALDLQLGPCHHINPPTRVHKGTEQSQTVAYIVT